MFAFTVLWHYDKREHKIKIQHGAILMLMQTLINLLMNPDVDEIKIIRGGD